jgi:HEAT repeat protein
VAGCLVLLTIASVPAARDRNHPLASPTADEYVFEGKPLGAWVADLKHKDPDVRLNAALAFRRMGPRGGQAAGALVAALRDKDEAVFRYVLEALGRVGRPAVPFLVAELKNPHRRFTAVVALLEIGPEAEAAAQPLMDVLQDPRLPEDDLGLRFHVCVVLGRIGKPAVQPAVRGLKDKVPRARRCVAAALMEIGMEIGPAAAEAVAPLVATLGDRDRTVRAIAAVALGEIHSSPERAVPALAKALRDEEGEVRRAASSALTRFGKAGLPSLLAALKDRNPAVRSAAALVLGQPDCEEKAVVKPLLAALDDREVEVRQAAAVALEDVALKGSAQVRPLDEAIPDLARGLKDPDIRSEAALALARMGGKAVPTLVRALADQDEDVRKAVAGALGSVGPKGRVAVPALIERLKDRSHDVRTCAVEALGSIGPAAKEAVPALGRAMKDRDFRKPAVEALGRIGEASLPVLLEGWSKGEAEERAEIALALARIGPKAEPALPLFVEALKDTDVSLCEAAAHAVGALGAAALPATPRLIALLQHKNDNLRFAAVEALEKLGPKAEAAIPALIEALRDKDGRVSCYAAYALGGFGPRAKEAVAPLIAARRNEGPVLRNTAALALWEIDPSAARNAGIPRLPVEDRGKPYTEPRALSP